MAGSIYSLQAKDLWGENVRLKDYKGKVLMVVNIASKCGLTPQLKALEEIYKKYQSRGFELLAFPSNQFANQEPLKGESMADSNI